MSHSTRVNLANFLLLNTAWFSCVLGAAAGNRWIGPATVAGFLVVHLLLAAKPRRELVVISCIALMGSSIEATLTHFQVYQFPTTTLWVGPIPLWIVCLWLMFATSMNTSLRWLHGRYAIAAGLGAISGPLSYHGGQALGAVTLNDDPWLSWGVLGAAWAVALPTSLYLARKLSH